MSSYQVSGETYLLSTNTSCASQFCGSRGEPVAALEQQDALAGGSQMPDQRSASGAASDHDYVVVVAHELISSSRSARMIRAAASIRAR